ncbi:acyltransferase family protein [Flavobacterium ajazii]|uniref:acyltransferase family protein n=1 Tax=Flavobacterium ajazii TaxID=2692318 RepID=UPI0013D4D60C|nr:acyltransferase [Flavobacterium ajazii]
MNVVKLQKLHYIDTIRGIAILMVISCHSAQLGAVKGSYLFSAFFSLGARGVQLFFIASAFTLFRSYKGRENLEKRPVQNFFIRRFFRIAPIYYLGIIYYFFRITYDLPYWFGSQLYISKSNLLSNVFFLHGISPYWINSFIPGGWSISVEMFFYVTSPFLFRKIRNINEAFIFLNFTLLIKLILQVFFHSFEVIPETYLWREFLFYYFPCQLPIFALGIMMYFFIEDKTSLKQINTKVLILFFILLFIQVGIKIDFLYLNHILFGILFLIFGVLLSKEKLKFLSNAVIQYVGRISFSMYIIHFIVISWLAKFDLIDFSNLYLINFLFRLLLTLIVSSIISTITYYTIEIPFQNLGKKIIRKREFKFNQKGNNLI